MTTKTYTPAQQTLAKLVVACAVAHMESYDHSAADAAQASNDAERIAKPNDMYAGMMTDYASFYKLPLYEACMKTCEMVHEAEMGLPVYLLLKYTWNDISMWAEDLLRGVAGEEIPA